MRPLKRMQSSNHIGICGRPDAESPLVLSALKQRPLSAKASLLVQDCMLLRITPQCAAFTRCIREDCEHAQMNE